MSVPPSSPARWPDRSRSRRARALAAVLVLAAVVVGILDAAAGAAAPAARPGHKGIDVVEVGGLLDPPTASLVLDAIDNANRSGATMLIIRLDSKGAVDVDPSKIVRAIQGSKVPVVALGRSVGRPGEGCGDPRARRGARRLRRAGFERRSGRPRQPRPSRRTRPARGPCDARRSREVRAAQRGRHPAAHDARGVGRHRVAHGRGRRDPPDHRRGDRHPRRQDGAHGRRSGQAVDREGRRARHRPAPPAEPGRRLRQPRPRCACAARARSARRSRTSCSSPGSPSSCSSSSRAVSGSRARSARSRRSARVTASRICRSRGGASRLLVDRDLRSLDRRAGGRARRVDDHRHGLSHRRIVQALRRFVEPRPGVVADPHRDPRDRRLLRRSRCPPSSGPGSRRRRWAARG